MKEMEESDVGERWRRMTEKNDGRERWKLWKSFEENFGSLVKLEALENACKFLEALWRFLKVRGRKRLSRLPIRANRMLLKS